MDSEISEFWQAAVARLADPDVLIVSPLCINATEFVMREEFLTTPNAR